MSIKGLIYYATKTGDKKVKVNLVFEDSIGNRLLHDVVYYLRIIKPLSVEEQDNTALMSDCILSGQKLSVRLKEPYPDCTLKLYSITGELAFASVISNSDAEFDLSGLPVGIYFITLRSGSHFYRDKIVLIR
jgi:hypothetical protein